MRRLNNATKLNIVLVLYSLVITLIVLIISFLFIQNNTITNTTADSELYYSYSLNQLPNDLNGTIQISPTQLYENTITGAELKNGFYDGLFKTSIVIISAVLVFVMIGSILVSKIIAKHILSPIEKITENLPETPQIYTDNYVGELKGIRRTVYDLSTKVAILLDEANSINSFITHEQKNLLAILKGKLQVEKNKDLVRIVDTMTSSLDDILALNATENISCDETIDAAILCAEAFDVYHEEYKNISLDIDEDNLLYIKGRYMWIYRAVCNLIENALKYSNGSNIFLSVHYKKNSVIIAVEDNGPGIEKDKLNKIFEHKYRCDNLKKDGNGIGLSLVAHVTNLCGGVTYVESKLNLKTKFYMVFKALTLD